MSRLMRGACAAALILLVAGCSKSSRTLVSPSSKVRPAHITLGDVGAAFEPSKISLVFGAGVPIRVHVRGAAGRDTSSATWHYSWDFDPGLIAVDSSNTSLPTTGMVLLGTPLRMDSTLVKVTVVEDDTLLVHELGTNVIATATLSVGFIRPADRDIVGDIRLYHIVHSVGGVIATEEDTAHAIFLNQDQTQTKLRAGAVLLAGTELTERHAADGQDYHGAVLFSVPSDVDVQTPGSAKDLKAQVPGIKLTVPGPANELVVTSPDGRNKVLHDAPLSLQWTGGVTVPQLNSFSPSAGKVGTTVTLLGRNFAYVKAVKYNDVPDDSFTVNSCTQITSHIPEGVRSAQNVYLTVVNQSGTITSTQLLGVDSVGTATAPRWPAPTGIRATADIGDLGDCPQVEITLTDATGFSMRFLAFDSGRYDMPIPQVQNLTPGQIRMTINRVVLTTVKSTFFGSLSTLNFTANIRIIEETHSTFFLQ